MIATVQRLYSCNYVTEVMKKPVRQVIFPAGIGFFVFFLCHLAFIYLYNYVSLIQLNPMYLRLCILFHSAIHFVLYFIFCMPGYQQYTILSFRTSFDFLTQKKTVAGQPSYYEFFSCLFSMRFTMRSDNPIFSEICEGLIPCCVKRLTTTGSGSLTSMICMSGS